MIRTSSLLLAAVIALSACSGSGSSQTPESTTPADAPAVETPTTTAPSPAETSTTSAATPPLTAGELGELFVAALNTGDAAAVAALAPAVASQDLQDVINSGPYASVDCQVLDGRDVCGISHENAAYDFVLDLSSGLITEIYYTGGG